MFNFSETSYTQCARQIEDLAAEFPLVLDPDMPTEKLKYIGPVYGVDSARAHTCVPPEAKIGERMCAADLYDSGTRIHVYEIVELDSIVGEEKAPWHPPKVTRRALVKLVHVARSHMDRLAAKERTT